MTPRSAHITDLVERDHGLRVVELREYRSAHIKYRRQISDLRRLLLHRWGERIPATEAAFREVAYMLDLLALYDERDRLMDDFLRTHTAFDEITSRRLAVAALARAPRGHTTKRLGELMGLDWVTRRQLRLTNIEAVDKPPRDVLDALYRQEGAAYGRRKRAVDRLLPKPISEAKRLSADMFRRRVAAIYAVLDLGSWVPVSKLCNLIERKFRKNTPFIGVTASSMPRVIRKIAARDPGLLTELRQPPGRPDLRPQLWVTIRPKDANGYRRYFATRLAGFDADTASGLPRWFYSEFERGLREGCGLHRDDEELMRLARARRVELIGDQRAKT
ncbi:hypothetical protein [Bradyrhizobium sp. SZCCHNS3004]|uniref:hypothetical protein n=1 Tax=Bradyrhizobium sp. SZCCHNS3004 TaxID=3057312 RepID=UPI0029169D9E|nr:hypothetical protein [Bradyrhizobium sp. SZCCHNS3004]